MRPADGGTASRLGWGGGGGSRAGKSDNEVPTYLCNQLPTCSADGPLSTRRIWPTSMGRLDCACAGGSIPISFSPQPAENGDWRWLVSSLPVGPPCDARRTTRMSYPPNLSLGCRMVASRACPSCIHYLSISLPLPKTMVPDSPPLFSDLLGPAQYIQTVTGAGDGDGAGPGPGLPAVPLLTPSTDQSSHRTPSHPIGATPLCLPRRR